MPHFDASSAECLVFTYKEGLLSAIAHDLKIRVGTFSIDANEQARTLSARFDAASLRVVCARENGADAPRILSAADKREIEGNIVRDVLEARTYPDILFTSTSVREADSGYILKGSLKLHGKTRQVSVRVRREHNRLIAEARIHQPDFGIQPYRALLGALKVQADVTVQVSVPAII